MSLLKTLKQQAREVYNLSDDYVRQFGKLTFISTWQAAIEAQDSSQQELTAYIDEQANEVAPEPNSDVLYVNGWARHREDYSEQEWASMLSKDVQEKAEVVREFWEERRDRLSDEVEAVVFPDNSEPTPANNVVSLRKPAPRRVQRRANRFWKALVA